MPVEHYFPEPLLFEPASGIHIHTIILLHGRGGSGDTFGPAILNTSFVLADDAPNSTRDGRVHNGTRAPREDSGVGTNFPTDDFVRDETSIKSSNNSSSPMTLAQVFPHARFVFPTAPKQRATVYKRSIIRQWFDDWHLGLTTDDVDSRYDLGLQTTGLGSTVAYLQRLVAEEAGLVGGTRNVVLGGISQGCAASLVASLLWEGDEGLGGFVGMCGWLPYIGQMRGQLGFGDGDGARTSSAGQEEEEVDFDPFERLTSPGCDGDSAGDIDGVGSVGAALEWLRGELEIPRQRVASSSVLTVNTPVILCHGQIDEKVAVSKARETAKFLADLGMGPYSLKEYTGVGHNFSAEMVSDIASFIRDVLG